MVKTRVYDSDVVEALEKLTKEIKKLTSRPAGTLLSPLKVIVIDPVP